MVCGKLFASINDKMIHYIKVHDHEYGPGGKQLYRTVSCWRCASQMPRDEDGRYRCSCGFAMPRKENRINTWIYDDQPDL